MAFSWVQTIASGAQIDRADIMEIRDNTDYLDNNIAYCTGHYGTYQATNYTTNRATHYATNQASNYATAYANCTTDYDVADEAAQVNDNTSYCASNVSSYYVGHKTLNDAAYNASVNANCPTDYSANESFW